MERLLVVSGRTARRRCEAGKVRARRETTAKGVVWLIHPDEVRPGAVTPAAIGAANEFEIGKGTGFDFVPEGADAAANVRPGAAIGGDAALLAHVLEENRRLWLALEAAQQSEAVTKAALREALKAMPKQLTAGEPSPTGTTTQETTGERSAPSSSVATSTLSGPDDELSADELLALCYRIHPG